MDQLRPRPRTRAPEPEPPRSSRLVRAPAGVAPARLYATALGVYEAFVNGERAGTAELTPGSTSYDRTLYAQASDVTAAVRPGSEHDRDRPVGRLVPRPGRRLPRTRGLGAAPRRPARAPPDFRRRLDPRRRHRRALDQRPRPDHPRRPDGRADTDFLAARGRNARCSSTRSPPRRSAGRPPRRCGASNAGRPCRSRSCPPAPGSPTSARTPRAGSPSPTSARRAPGPCSTTASTSTLRAISRRRTWTRPPGRAAGPVRRAGRGGLLGRAG